MNRFLDLEDSLKSYRKKSPFAIFTLTKRQWSAAQTVNWCDIKNNIVRLGTEEEEDVWTMPDGITKRRENEPAMLPFLEKYWKEGVKSSNWAADAKKSQSSKAWSAAFISWIMREAGVKASHGFRFAGRHMNYIVEALRNREGERAGMTQYKDKAFWLYALNEQDVTKVGIGDLLCMNRKSNGKMTNYTFGGLKRKFFDGGNHSRNDTYGASHCDVVISKEKQNGKTYLYAVGGNKGIPGGKNRGWSVNSILVEIDEDGKIVNPSKHNIFGFIKLRECSNYNKEISSEISM